jgi:hypothetical protein
VYAATVDDKARAARRRAGRAAPPALPQAFHPFLCAPVPPIPLFGRPLPTCPARPCPLASPAQVAVKIGKGGWSPNDARIDVGQKEWKLAASGQNVAVWVAVM